MSERGPVLRAARLIPVLLAGAVMIVALAAAITVAEAQQQPPRYVLDKTVSYNPPSAEGVNIGETFTVTLWFENRWDRSTVVQVRDNNPAPQYLEILPGTITEGATYIPGSPPAVPDAVEWQGALDPGDLVSVTFQMLATGGAAWTVQNVAWLDYSGTPDSTPDAGDTADIRILGTSQTCLPLIFRGWPPTAESPVLQPIANPDGDGSYPVSWSAAPRAEAYSLQEATNSSFTGATQVYLGPATTYSAVDRGPTRYYYRVRSESSWGSSAWSNVQSVDVLWEKEPNDVYNLANGSLLSGLTYYGTFPDDADINDYFYFDRATDGPIEVWLRSIPVGQNYDLVLRTADRIPLGYSGNLDNADENIQTGTLPAGTYLIQVYHRSRGGSAEPYHLQVDY